MRGPSLRGDETGSAVAEFALVGALLTLLLLAVLQFALVLFVRNTVRDAAAEGARTAALAGSELEAGTARTRELISEAVGARYARRLEARYTTLAGVPVVEIRVSSPLPLIGLVGFAGGLEVSGHAAVETVETAAAG